MGENIALVRKGYAAFVAGDLTTLASLYARDAVHHVPGNNQTSGAHKGVDAVMALYAKLFELTEGTFKVELEHLSADDQGHVVAVHRTTAQRNGKTYDAKTALIFQIAGGKVLDICQCSPDLDADDAFWA